MMNTTHYIRGLRIRRRALICSLVAASWSTPILAQDDVADIPSQDLRIGGDEHQRYFLIGPKDGAKEPKTGYKLLIVMPGGSGDAGFHPFVKRIYTNALPPGY